MALPASFLAHLQTNGYHPRSDKHSNALAEAIVADLIAACPPIAARAVRGQVVYAVNFDLRYATAEWNVDLVIGTPPPGTPPPPSGVSILRSAPALVQIACEIKAVMTEHRKAVKNRKRDLEAHHEHVHNYSPATIAAGVLVVNIATRYRSPTRGGTITTHSNPAALVTHCVNQAAAISVAGGPTGRGLDAMCVIVLDMDNINAATTRYHQTAPAPRVGDPMHYDSFIARICAEYTRRFP